MRMAATNAVVTFIENNIQSLMSQLTHNGKLSTHKDDQFYLGKLEAYQDLYEGITGETWTGE